MLNVKIKGLPQAQKFLSLKKTEKLEKANQAIHRAGLFLETETKESIAGNKQEIRSVDTGRFLNSVSTDNQKFLESTVFSNVEYAKYLENGTSRIRPRKHFEMSVARNKRKIINNKLD